MATLIARYLLNEASGDALDSAGVGASDLTVYPTGHCGTDADTVLERQYGGNPRYRITRHDTLCLDGGGSPTHASVRKLVGSFPALDPNTSFTVAIKFVWEGNYTFRNLRKQGLVGTRQHPGNANGWVLSYLPNNQALAFGTTVGGLGEVVNGISGTPPSAGQEVEVHVTYTGTDTQYGADRLRMYLDGALDVEGAAPASFGFNGTNFTIGMNDHNSATFGAWERWQGQFWDCRIWSPLLTNEEISPPVVSPAGDIWLDGTFLAVETEEP